MVETGALVRYRFGRFELQPGERLLLDSGAPVRLGPHAFDLLVVLVERSGRLVTKDELLERVWPRVVVEENTLQVHVSALRKVLGAQTIETVPGHGYRFTAVVTHLGASATPASAPPASTHPKGNLPFDLTSFIGRENQLTELEGLLQGARLVTLTGAGGCGKTRLGIRLARERAGVYADGAWLVELAPLADPGLLPQAVAGVLGVSERLGTPRLDAIAAHLSSRQILLVLDNAEHMLDAAATLAESLLRRCQRLTVLVTSRERLSVTGELVYRVPSLSVPSEDDTTPESIGAFESARLFLDRVRLQRPDFELTKENAPAIGSICRRLDGIALALELAAPRARVFSMEELSRSLDRRFGVLTEGSRSALPRHRTLRAMIDWSHELLDEEERAMLRSASVFAGGWTVEAAAAVCGGSGVDGHVAGRLLTALADKNLIVEDSADGRVRYGMLETMRDYARERLCESVEEAQVRAAHAEYFAAFTKEADVPLQRAEVLDRLEEEHDNLRAALSHSTAHQGTAMASVLWRMWLVRGYVTEGRALLDRQLAQPAEESIARSRVLQGASVLARVAGDMQCARRLGEEAVAMRRRVGDRRGLAIALSSLGNALEDLGEHDGGRARQEESLAIFRELGDRLGIASALNNLAVSVSRAGDLDYARTLHEEALALRRELGDLGGVGASLNNLAEVAHESGALEKSIELNVAAEAAHRELGDQRQLANTLVHRAFVLCELGRRAEARRIFLDALATFRDRGDRPNVRWSLLGVGYTLAADDPRGAAWLWGAAERAREVDGGTRSAFEAACDKRERERALAALGDLAAFERAWAEGRAWDLEKAVRYALELCPLR